MTMTLLKILLSSHASVTINGQLFLKMF